MLTRAARRRHALRHLQQVAEQIQLPWLCPAVALPPGFSFRRTITSRPSISKTKQTAAQLLQTRQLASAAPLPEGYERNDDYTSSRFYPQQHLPIAQRRDQEISALRQWDLSNLIRIDNSTELPPEQMNTNQVIGSDIRGNSVEVERNLEACLELKKWSRAFASLEQLKILYYNSAEKLRSQYNKVLAYLVDDLIVSRRHDNEEKITQWIERDMKRVQLEPDAHTFALVIKAALGSLAGSKRDRTVRRYWDMAKRYDLQAQVGSLRSILSERDLGQISEICPLDATEWRNIDTEFYHESDPEIMLSQDTVSQRANISVAETEQKGMGLISLKKSLSLFSKSQDFEDRLGTTTEEYTTERQRRLEHDSIDAALNRWKIEHDKLRRVGKIGRTTSGKLGAMLWQWNEIMTQKIVEELKKVHEAESKTRKIAPDRLRVEYGPFLEQMQPEKVAAITSIALLQILNKIGASKPIKLVRLVTELGRAVEAEFQAERRHRVTVEALRRRRLASRSKAASNDSQPPATPLPKESTTHPLRHTFGPGALPYLGRSEWTIGIHAKLGAVLCEMMFDTARITVSKEDKSSGKTLTVVQPVFIREKMCQNGKQIGMVSLNENFVEIMAAQPPADMIAKQLPMVSKPRPWTGFYDGGYLESDQPVLRVKNSERLQQDYAMAAAARGDLDQLFAGLDVLGNTGWKINPKVFDVMVKAWNSGEAVANLPPLKKDFELPERPASDATSKQKFDWYSKMRTIENEKSGNHSNRCFQNFQMEIAKAYKDETFYLPHNADFRGRAYPIPPYLNQMGADNCRGLLMFSNGRELGADGLRWLKIHLSNVFGYDKASLSDREKFPMDHIDDVRDSVENPLSGRKWWLTADDPWQCLATCFELIDALDSPDPAQFVSHLPVHQDGSCNGLQHYAALGGDVAGAKQVNLEPGDKPADVYTGVAELVKAEIAIDAAEGTPIAKLLDGKITRKIVKQTVMTNVYGVTFLGAIRQVRRQVDDIIPEVAEAGKSGQAATYIARKIFKALGSLFTGAHDIQYWLGDCANRISDSLSPAQLEKIAEKEEVKTSNHTPLPGRRKDIKRKKKNPLEPDAFRTSVIWTTPIKLPVVQPYRVPKGRKIQTNLQNITIVEPSVADAINKRKQLQAFPPNFIHSLDATHMILSALKADELGLNFSAVHDSFWTHAADVNTLNQLLRDAFIRMHSDDIIGRLAAEFKTRYDGHVYIAHIKKGNRLAKAIMEYRRQLVAEGTLCHGTGTKSIQQRKYAELLREIKKQRLMRSENPKEREEGEKMVTAATLFQQHNGEKYISSKDSLGETAIGRLPEAVSDATVEKALESTEVAEDVDLQRTLEPFTDSIADEDLVEAHSNDSELVQETKHLAETISIENASQEPDGKKKKSTLSKQKQVWLWLPLTFRPVPPKGEFDVTRLRDSQYFFS